MTPAKRRPATPASKGPTSTAPDVPVVADPSPAPTKEGAELPGDSAPPTETGQVDPEHPATKQSPRRSRGRYPLPVWPD